MTNATRILIVEDDEEIAELVRDFLTSAGMAVSIAGNAQEMDAYLEHDTPSLVLLDLMLPGEDGLQILRRLRAKSQLPVIMLTAIKEEADRIVGLELGADDYLGKPFSQRELLARIRAVLRRTKDSETASVRNHARYSFDGWNLCTASRVLTDPSGAEVSVTSGEFDLLWAFCENPQRVLSRDQLVELSHGRGASPFNRSIDTLVSRIRNKIEQDARKPLLLKTVRLGGYFFAPEVEKN